MWETNCETSPHYLHTSFPGVLINLRMKVHIWYEKVEALRKQFWTIMTSCKKRGEDCTDALWQRFVPVAQRQAGEHRWTKQVISWVTVVEDHAAKRKVAVLNLTLPDGIGGDSWVGAIYH